MLGRQAEEDRNALAQLFTGLEEQQEQTVSSTLSQSRQVPRLPAQCPSHQDICQGWGLGVVGLGFLKETVRGFLSQGAERSNL